MSDIHSDCDDRREPYLKDNKMVDGVTEIPKYRTMDNREFGKLDEANAHQEKLNEQKYLDNRIREIVNIIHKHVGTQKIHGRVIWDVGEILLKRPMVKEIAENIGAYDDDLKLYLVTDQNYRAVVAASDVKEIPYIKFFEGQKLSELIIDHIGNATSDIQPGLVAITTGPIG